MAGLAVVEASESQFGSTTTSSAVLIDGFLGCCHLSRCSFVGFAGSFPGLMDLMSLVGSRAGAAADLGLQLAAVAGLGRSCCTPLQSEKLIAS